MKGRIKILLCIYEQQKKQSQMPCQVSICLLQLITIHQHFLNIIIPGYTFLFNYFICALNRKKLKFSLRKYKMKHKLNYVNNSPNKDNLIHIYVFMAKSVMTVLNNKHYFHDKILECSLYFMQLQTML